MDAGEQIERIDAASMDILENVGVVFRDEIAIEDWKRAGADIRDGDRVHLDRGLVRELMSPRSPKPSPITPATRPITCPSDAITRSFVPMTGAPYLRDLDDVRRNPTLDDLANFHKLSHMLPALHSSAHHIVEPYDHPISQRHLRITYSSMKHSDKTFMGMTTSPKNAEDVMEMCAILFGEEYLETHPVCTGNCNGNSPLVWDETMLGAMRAFNKRNQPVLCSPLRAGRRQHAGLGRAHRGAAQCRSLERARLYAGGAQGLPGDLRALPFSTVSMKSGAPMAGTPEISADEHDDRPDGAVLPGAVAQFEHAGRGQDAWMRRRAMKVPRP